MDSALFWFFAISGIVFWAAIVVAVVFGLFLWAIAHRPDPYPQVTGPTASVADVDEGLKKIEEDSQDWVRSYGERSESHRARVREDNDWAGASASLRASLRC